MSYKVKPLDLLEHSLWPLSQVSSEEIADWSIPERLGGRGLNIP